MAMRFFACAGSLNRVNKEPESRSRKPMKPNIKHVSRPREGGCAGAIRSTHWGLSSAINPAGASVASLSLSFIVLRCDA